MNITFEIEGKVYELPKFINPEQYAKIFKLKDVLEDQYFAVKLLSTLSGCPEEELETVNYQQIKHLSTYAMTMFPMQREKFVDRFTVDGVEYGFLDSWKNLSFAEWVDLDTLITKNPDQLMDNIPIILAIMYRPIIEEKKNKYIIEKYNPETVEQRADLFKTKLDIRTYFGTMVFFSLFAKRYTTNIQQSSMKVNLWTQMNLLWKYRRTIRSLLKGDGDGTSYSIDSLTMILQNTVKSYRRPLWKRLIKPRFLFQKKKK